MKIKGQKKNNQEDIKLPEMEKKLQKLKTKNLNPNIKNLNNDVAKR